MNVDELLNQGVAFKRKGDLDNALLCYKKAAELAPTNYMVHYSMAKTLYLSKFELQSQLGEKLTESDMQEIMVITVKEYVSSIRFLMPNYLSLLKKLFNFHTDREEILSTHFFTNQMIHLGHAAMDLVPSHFKYIMGEVRLLNPSLNLEQIEDLAVYNILKYIAEIAGGFMSEPVVPKITNFNINLDKFYHQNGVRICVGLLDWDEFK